MNPYQAQTTCALCGGPGAALVRDATAEWLGVDLYHKDPRFCRDYLSKRAQQAEEDVKRAALEGA